MVFCLHTKFDVSRPSEHLFLDYVFQCKPHPGENDGQMTMEYHGLPWQSMVIQPWSTMVDHGRPCFVKWPPMVDHGLINNMSNHGRPWSRTMVGHG